MKKNTILGAPLGINIIALYFTFTTYVFATAPGVVCNGLPGCGSDTVGTVKNDISQKDFFSFIGKMISEGINYVAVIAVISLIISGMMYLTSGGEDEKIKKAKKWITWSLVGVLISTSAWAIINLANSFKITTT